MDKEFVESLRELREGEIEIKLKEVGWRRCSAGFMMENQAITRAVLPQGNETSKEVLFLDYNVLRPKQYEPHECYAIFVRD